ncbi:MAG: hypothetical protein ACTSUE_14315 [Promethearchaeota archaeon]
MSQVLKPIYAQSIINVSRAKDVIDFSQVLIYDYEDVSPAQVYHERIFNDHTFMERELKTIETKLQSFLDAEKNVVNGERVFPTIHHVSIDFKSDPKFFSYSWLIQWQGPVAPEELQVYEAIVDPATLEYNVKSMYIFPTGTKIVDIDSSLHYENDIPHFIIYRGEKNQKVNELERITWNWI